VFVGERGSKYFLDRKWNETIPLLSTLMRVTLNIALFLCLIILIVIVIIVICVIIIHCY
jgi:hypothetical protein